MKKRILVLLMVLTLLLTACGGGDTSAPSDGSSEEQQVTLILSNITTDAGELAGDKFVELVKEYSNGSIIVNHFPDNQLGDDKTVLEQTQIGDIDIAVSSTSPLVNVYPDYYLFDAPYLFLNRDDAINVGLKSEEAMAIRDGIEAIGLKGLAWWENGFRNTTSSDTPKRVPADVEGMKIRTMENDVHLAAWKAFGANPTPMAFSEVFTAMQQGTIDGQENPLAIITGNKFYEVQKYISKTEHIYVPFCVVMNLDKFNSLTKNQQDAIVKAMDEATEYQYEINAKLDKEAVKVITDAGSEIIELTADEKAQWQQIMDDAKIFDMVKDKMEHPEYLDAMLEATK